jgi:hypothetical protein
MSRACKRAAPGVTGIEASVADDDDDQAAAQDGQASDGLGFAIDEPEETPGKKPALPPILEPRRPTIQAHLKPLR